MCEKSLHRLTFKMLKCVYYSQEFKINVDTFFIAFNLQFVFIVRLILYKTCVQNKPK